MEKVLAASAASPSPQTMELVFTRWEEVAGAELAAIHDRCGCRIRRWWWGSITRPGPPGPAWNPSAILRRVHELGDTTIERIEVVVQRP